MSYRYLEDIATADAAFEVEGRTLEELFREAAVATFEVMVDTSTVKPEIMREINMKNEDAGNLLFDWLSELVYLKDAESLIFSRFEINIIRDDFYILKATASGELIDAKVHNLRSDVKAVTYHKFEIKKMDEKWTARIVLDI